MNQAPYLLPGTGWFQILTWSSLPLSDSSFPSTHPPSRHATCCGAYPRPATFASSEEMHLRWMPATLTVVAVETVFQSPSACCISARDTVDLALITTFSGSANGGIWLSGVAALAVSQSAGAQ